MHKSIVERIVPQRVRETVKWMNFHLSEEGRVIYNFAKTLPAAQRQCVIELGEGFTAGGAKRSAPQAVGNVMTSLIVGQGMWYIACPLISRSPWIRNTVLGWVVGGGSDKLFLSPEKLLFHTGGYSRSVATQLTAKVPKTFAAGAAMLGIELITDFSRCFIEYWTQKKFGIVADGVARACGQARPFVARYSSLEAYQKIIGYALRPWTIGTPEQIFSSIQGFMGSLWRTGPQLAIVLTAGRAIDAFLGKVSEATGLRRVAERISEDGAARQRAAMEAIGAIVGQEKLAALKFQLAAVSRSYWKWNPFAPVLSHEKAELAAHAASGYLELEKTLNLCSNPQNLKTAGSEVISGIMRCRKALADVVGEKTLAAMENQDKEAPRAVLRFISGIKTFLAAIAGRKESKVQSMERIDYESLQRKYAALGRLMVALQTERRLK